MSYRTQWRMNIKNVDGSNKKVPLKKIEKLIEENEDISWVLGEGIGHWGEDDRSWETKKKDMKELTTQFPQLLFIIEYSPDEDGDMGLTREYWVDGKVQIEQAKIVIDDFDINKLK